MKKRILSFFFVALLCLSLAVAAHGSPATPDFVVDEAGLLTQREENALAGKLQQVSESCNAQIAVVTVSSLDGRSMGRFAESVYDEKGYGYGSNRDGVLLVVCMDIREYWIVSNGYAGKAIGSAEIDAIGEAITSDLSEGDYAGAFHTYLEECEHYLDGYLNGFPFDVQKNLIIAVIIGIVVSLVVTGILKGQLKSVRKQNQANAYVKAGSMRITQSSDFFLYRNVTRTPKPQNKSSGSGSSRSSGGGRF